MLNSSDGGLSWSKQFDGVQAANIALAAAVNAYIEKFGNNATTSANLQAAQSMMNGGPSVSFLDIYATSSNNLIIVVAFGIAYRRRSPPARGVSHLTKLVLELDVYS